MACEACNKVQNETQEHVIQWPANNKLREGLIKYFRGVMMVKDKLGTKSIKLV
jgi:hypothetical protein